MMQIPCPYCGSRDEAEFKYGGDSHVDRPAPPGSINEDQWADYLFYHDISKGVKAERWMHAFGCRRWFNLLRNTLTHEIHGAYPMGAQRPDGAQS